MITEVSNGLAIPTGEFPEGKLHPEGSLHHFLARFKTKPFEKRSRRTIDPKRRLAVLRKTYGVLNEADGLAFESVIAESRGFSSETCPAAA